MAFNWKDYLTVAKMLSQEVRGVSAEAACRCAVSRAYYAVHCFARNYASLRFGFQPTFRAQDHGLVIDLFRRVDPEVANHIVNLMLWRAQCDYRNDVPNLDRMPPLAIFMAEAVFNKLK